MFIGERPNFRTTFSGRHFRRIPRGEMMEIRRNGVMRNVRPSRIVQIFINNVREKRTRARKRVCICVCVCVALSESSSSLRLCCIAGSCTLRSVKERTQRIFMSSAIAFPLHNISEHLSSFLAPL